MAKNELGTKRTCPVTGKKFYDLNRDPIVSPYTGQSYPRAFFDPQLRVPKAAEPDDDSADDEAGEEAELVSLEDADAEATKVPEADVDVDVDAGDVDADDDDDTFLEADEDEDDGDVTGLIDGELEEDEES